MNYKKITTTIKSLKLEFLKLPKRRSLQTARNNFNNNGTLPQSCRFKTILLWDEGIVRFCQTLERIQILYNSHIMIFLNPCCQLVNFQELEDSQAVVDFGFNHLHSRVHCHFLCAIYEDLQYSTCLPTNSMAQFHNVL